MIIGIQADNGLSSIIEIDEALLGVQPQPLAFVVEQMIPHLNEIVKRLEEVAP